jgi:hypothetical protein
VDLVGGQRHADPHRRGADRATPAVNTIGMTTGGVETFTLPQNAYFKSSVANGFEVTPGEGQ